MADLYGCDNYHGKVVILQMNKPKILLFSRRKSNQIKTKIRKVKQTSHCMQGQRYIRPSTPIT